MPAVLYARFSPRPLAQECDSVERQLSDLRSWCEGRFEIRSEHWDKSLSGNDRDRPGLFDAIRSCQKGDVLLVRDWSRFCRDRTYAAIILEDLAKRAVKVVSITEQGDMPETMESRLLRNIMLDIDEYKRGLIAAKTRSAMLAHQKSGRVMGGIPMGYMRIGKRLEQHAFEQGQILVIKSMRDDDGMTCHEIASLLNKRNVPCRGKRWYASTVWRILNRDESLLPETGHANRS
jgi:DNA invertase Pin-like site-specific DNA recombinase